MSFADWKQITNHTKQSFGKYYQLFENSTKSFRVAKGYGTVDGGKIGIILTKCLHKILHGNFV
ncbi:Uncharacterised protein [Moraxella ovis]|nr:Uncharacterised protein [Moraxella ovis]STZ06764.1 Uncharacterised protein [Moraxella ovis]